jgi:hypothetical protein
MVKHGEGPKFLWVTGYTRWVEGKLKKVDSHHRGYTYPLNLRESDLQLDFGF